MFRFPRPGTLQAKLTFLIFCGTTFVPGKIPTEPEPRGGVVAETQKFPRHRETLGLRDLVVRHHLERTY